MTVMLDTNVCVTIMRQPIEAEKLTRILIDLSCSEALLSSITLFELEMGVSGRQGEAKARKSLESLLNGPFVIVPFDATAARHSATFGANARGRGQQLSAMDNLIAGHALALGAKLVTNDARLAASMSENDVVTRQ